MRGQLRLCSRLGTLHLRPPPLRQPLEPLRQIVGERQSVRAGAPVASGGLSGARNLLLTLV